MIGIWPYLNGSLNGFDRYLAGFDRYLAAFDRYLAGFDRYLAAFDRDLVALNGFDRYLAAFDRYCIWSVFGRSRPEFDCSRPGFGLHSRASLLEETPVCYYGDWLK